MKIQVKQFAKKKIEAVKSGVKSRSGARLSKKPPLTPAKLKQIDAYWRAANYLAAGQLYLLDNPLLREPLRPEHLKRTLVGHWGTVPAKTLSTPT